VPDPNEPPSPLDGLVHVPAFDLPASPAMSERARVLLARRTSGPAVSVHAAARAGAGGEEAWLASMRDFRAGMADLHERLLARLRRTYAADVEETELGGVRVELVTPQGGVAPGNDGRILVNLHGGAFVGGAERCGLVEAIPVACTAGVRVAVVDYRQGWEHRFPAASEDVAAVVEALSADYDPAAIGVFGYSAGGSLTAQAVAWLLRHGGPVPGAVALCSAGAGGVAGSRGDSSYLALAALGDPPPPPRPPDEVPAPEPYGYFAGVDPADPLMAPLEDPALLASFPPALLLTGTRSFDMSAAVTTHRALLAAGVDAELHVWEGMWHCFPYNVEMPEAQDAIATLARFFDRRLGGRPSRRGGDPS